MALGGVHWHAVQVSVVLEAAGPRGRSLTSSASVPSCIRRARASLSQGGSADSVGTEADHSAWGLYTAVALYMHLPSEVISLPPTIKTKQGVSFPSRGLV